MGERNQMLHYSLQVRDFQPISHNETSSYFLMIQAFSVCDSLNATDTHKLVGSGTIGGVALLEKV